MKLTISLLTIAALAVLSRPGLAGSITITNPSFELPSLGGSGYEAVGDGWTGTGIFYAPPSEVYPAASIPNGTQILVFGDDPSESDHESVSQTLSTAWAANTTYTLTFDVGAFPSNLAGYSGYVATLSAGADVLATDKNQLTPTPGTFSLDTLTFATGGTAPTGDITIGFADPSEPGVVAFDEVQLSATSNVGPPPSGVPEPRSWCALAVGIGALLAAKRREVSRAIRDGALAR
jgi:hypothetical protein